MSQEIIPTAATIPEPAQPAVAKLDRNPAAIYLATLRPTGRRSMHHYLNVIAGLASDQKHTALTLPWQELRYQHTAAIRSLLQDRYKPATAATAVNALRRVLKEAWRLGLMDAEDYRRAVDLQTIRGQTLLRGRQLKSTELTTLMRTCLKDHSPSGIRDAAMLAVLYGAGLRRSEVVKLRVADYDPENGAITVLSAKGGKDRLCYLGSKKEIGQWLDIRGNAAGPLFLPIHKTGKIGTAIMSDQAVLKILKKRGLQAGLASFSPHDLRRTFISDLLDAGADIATVQKLAGHADVSTTARYDRRGEGAKLKAANLLRITTDGEEEI